MATRIYGVQPGGKLVDVVENVGPTATSAVVAIVVDLASSVTNGSTTRGVSKSEVLLAIETLQAYIIADQWPPA